MVLQPIYVKSHGERIVVAESRGEPVFSLAKSEADKFKQAAGVSKRNKLLTLYQGKELQIMETSVKGA